MSIMLWTQDAAAVSTEVQKQCPASARNALMRAEEICRREFLFRDHWEMEPTHKPVRFSGSVQWNAVPFGDPEWTYALNRHTILLNLAKAWCFTGEERFRAAFVELLTDWLDRVPHTPKSERTTWRALEAGLRPENWLRAVELFGDALPAPLLERMNESLAEHGAFLVREHKAFHQLSNWGAIQSHGLFLIGLWLSRKDWQTLALERLTENLRNAVLPDGVQWEQSPMYHCEVLHAAADTLLLTRRNGIQVPSALEETIHRMFRALAVWVTPSREILPQSDSDCIDAGDLLAQGALLFADPELAAAAEGALCEETLWDFGVDARTKLDALPKRRPAIPSQALESSGNYMLRSGWGVNDTYIHLHCGSLGGGHGHADLLHLDVWHHGEAVLADAGRYTYVEGAERVWFKSPAAHNTFRVDETDFTRYRATWEWAEIARPLPTETHFTPQADLLRAGHLGYAAQGITAEREIVFIKPDLLIGVDRLFAPEGTRHTVEQFFHFGSGTLEQDGASVFWQGKQTCAQLHWLAGQFAARSALPAAPLYNLQIKTPVLGLKYHTKSTAILPFVLCLGGTCKIELLPVTDGNGRPLASDAVQAVRITRNGQSVTVIFCHKTGAHDAALLCADGCVGHGSVLVFTPQSPDGLCLR